MKRLLFVFLVVLCAGTLSAQSMKDYLGTWRYEKGDTIFTIRLIEGAIITSEGERLDDEECRVMFGGYSLQVKGKVITNCIDTISPEWLIANARTGVEQKVYIKVYYHLNSPSSVGVVFYDQIKRHFKGKGILGGGMKFIAPGKLHWILDEKMGIWWETEGDEDAPEVKPIGFSVPTDAILIKVKP